MHFFRALGDKSGPPSLPDEASEGQEVNGETAVGEEGEEELERVEEEQRSTWETVTDEACSSVDKLSLDLQEEVVGAKVNEGDEGHQDDQEMTQGSRLCIYVCVGVGAHTHTHIQADT